MNLVYVNVNVWIAALSLRYLLSLALCIDYRLSSQSLGRHPTLGLSLLAASGMQQKLKTHILCTFVGLVFCIHISTPDWVLMKSWKHVGPIHEEGGG
jgi:hypothetical protein